MEVSAYCLKQYINTYRKINIGGLNHSLVGQEGTGVWDHLGFLGPKINH